jgi:phosphoserine aminotransferase
MIHTNFTPGPSQLYFTVADHARQAFKNGIPSISHRSKQFETISKEATDGLRELLGIPSEHHIFFTSSATEIWERIIQNLVSETSLHLVNGSFSKRFYEIAGQLGKTAEKIEAAEGQGFDSINVTPGTELVAVTHNETSTGVSIPTDAIHQLKARYPEALLAVDAVSSLPYPAFKYDLVDTVFFSVQKAFGLPAGLGVWIVNNQCVEKASRLAKEGKNIGTYHNIPSLLSHSLKHQTPETPNVLAIYLLSRVIQDFLRRGVDTMRRETDYKAAILYHALKEHPQLTAFVKQPQFQSKTVIVADCQAHTEALAKHLQKNGLFPGDGYGTFKKSQLRFANFPAHSKEQYELLVDTIATFNG